LTSFTIKSFLASFVGLAFVGSAFGGASSTTAACGASVLAAYTSSAEIVKLNL
jgi:hypothetical protein